MKIPTKKYHYTYPVSLHDRVAAIGEGNFVAGLRIMDSHCQHLRLPEKPVKSGYVTVADKNALRRADNAARDAALPPDFAAKLRELGYDLGMMSDASVTRMLADWQSRQTEAKPKPVAAKVVDDPDDDWGMSAIFDGSWKQK